MTDEFTGAAHNLRLRAAGKKLAEAFGWWQDPNGMLRSSEDHKRPLLEWHDVVDALVRANVVTRICFDVSWIDGLPNYSVNIAGPVHSASAGSTNVKHALSNAIIALVLDPYLKIEPEKGIGT